MQPNRNYGSKSRYYRRPRWQCRARQLEPILSTVRQGVRVSVDCEGVELLTKDGNALAGIAKKGLAQVSIVDEFGNLLYDTFVCQAANVTWKLPPRFLNLSLMYEDLRPENGAQPLAKVLADVKSIFDASGIIVGHAIHNEKHYLRGIDFSVYELRDTQRAAVFQEYAKNPKEGPPLKLLSLQLLGKSIQSNGHSSAEDAQATMELYKLEQAAIDQEQGRAPPPPTVPTPAPTAPTVAPPAPTTTSSAAAATTSTIPTVSIPAATPTAAAPPKPSWAEIAGGLRKK